MFHLIAISAAIIIGVAVGATVEHLEWLSTTASTFLGVGVAVCLYEVLKRLGGKSRHPR